MIVHIEYSCPECEKKFNCPANLASHRRWHRPKDSEQTRGQISDGRDVGDISRRHRETEVTHENLNKFPLLSFYPSIFHSVNRFFDDSADIPEDLKRSHNKFSISSILGKSED